MPLTRTQKEELLKVYEGGLSTAPHVFVMGFSGINVPDVTDLRRQVREAGGTYMVVKNRLVLRAVEGEALGELKGHFSGPTAVAYAQDDPVAVAKVLTEFAKGKPTLEFKAGLVEGRQVAGEDIPAIAALPSREELIAKLLFLLQSPVTRLVRTLGALPRQFVTVLDQVKQKKAGEAG